jgi:hypothetical protein
LRPSTATVALLSPASSPSSWSRISVPKRCRSAQRRYIRSEHLGPVGRLGATGAGADRHDRERSSYGPLNIRLVRRRFELGGQGAVLGVEAGEHLLVVALGGQPASSSMSSARCNQRAPGGDLIAQALGRTQHLLGGALIGPEVGRAGLLVERREALFLGG